MGVDVFHHHRPEFLNGQELDIYLEYQDMKIGIEYQGKQHFESVQFFGGEEGLSKTLSRDKRKSEKCYEHGVKLIYFNYWESITRDLVISRLSENQLYVDNN
jgi:hypothetical protein